MPLADRKTLLKTLAAVDLVDLDQLLFGKTTPDQVQKFFLEGEWCEEHYHVDGIKKFLRTPEQKATLDSLDLSIEDMLNGRYSDEAAVLEIYKQWNEKLGFRSFGH